MNIQGLCPQTVPSKVPYVRDLLMEGKQLFIGLSETWLKNHKEAELDIEVYSLDIEVYSLFHTDSARLRKGRSRACGGVCSR